MNSKVIIVPNNLGEVVSLMPGYTNIYQINIQQTKCLFTQNGAIKKELIKSVIIGNESDLNRLVEHGLELEGTIIVRDSIIPYTNQRDQDLSLCPETGILLKYNNNPIYRKCFYSNNKTAKDEIIEYNNLDEIRSAKNSSTLK